jgi:hypothetical protein
MNRRRPGRLAAAAALLSLAVLGDPLVRPAACQMVCLEPLPWPQKGPDAVARALHVGVARSQDEKTRWLAHAVSLLGLTPVGDRSALFVRVQYLSLDTAGWAAVDRWPSLRGEKAVAEWPLESRSVGFGSPEVGVLSASDLPGVGRWGIGASIVLPFGRDVLYPFASTSLPIRLELRRTVSLGDAWAASVGGGRTSIIDSARDNLAAEAFPAMTLVSLDLERAWQAARWASVGWRGEWGGGGRSSRICVRWRLPAKEGSAIALDVERELAGSADRAFGTRISLALVFSGTAREPEAAGGPVAK